MQSTAFGICKHWKRTQMAERHLLNHKKRCSAAVLLQSMSYNFLWILCEQYSLDLSYWLAEIQTALQK